MNLFKKKLTPDFTQLPAHIAIIMDGNGRWAKKRGLARTIGHAAGAENFRTIATYCRDIGLKYLTVYAFSTENWKRPLDEVAVIWDLLKKYLYEAVETMEKDKVKLRILGDLGPMPEEIKNLVAKTNEISSHYEGTQYNICINYGGRDEIVRACRTLAEECKEGVLEPSDINEKLISSKLFSFDITDPDLIIRPSGEMRLSNFLLWQSAYSEFYFTNTLWPDFSVEELNNAIAEYQKRERRFGGVDN